MDARLLAIYLNDHLAGSTLALELARRSHKDNLRNEYGQFLLALISELQQDRHTLLEIFRALGIHPSRAKQGFVWLAEHAGRLKLNGRLFGYSPLSRLVEIEALLIGVESKRRLWRVLEDVCGLLPSLAGINFEELSARADQQLEALDRFRVLAARRAFTGKAAAPAGATSSWLPAGSR